MRQLIQRTLEEDDGRKEIIVLADLIKLTINARSKDVVFMLI